MAKASQFLKLVDKNGRMVRGECLDADYLAQIMLTAWNWDVKDPAAERKKAAVPADAAGAKDKTKTRKESETGDNSKPSYFTISKPTDRSTTRLIKAMDNGEIFPTAVLVIKEEYEEAPLPFRMEIELKEVFLVNFTWSATAAAAGMDFAESWDLNYSSIELKYLWRGSPAGWIQTRFDRPPDADEGASTKAPLTAAEKKAELDKQIKEGIAQLKKTGK